MQIRTWEVIGGYRAHVWRYDVSLSTYPFSGHASHETLEGAIKLATAQMTGFEAILRDRQKQGYTAGNPGLAELLHALHRAVQINESLRGGSWERFRALDETGCVNQLSRAPTGGRNGGT
jgi:hypothetical protein